MKAIAVWLAASLLFGALAAWEGSWVRYAFLAFSALALLAAFASPGRSARL